MKKVATEENCDPDKLVNGFSITNCFLEPNKGREKHYN